MQFHNAEPQCCKIHAGTPMRQLVALQVCLGNLRHGSDAGGLLLRWQPCRCPLQFFFTLLLVLLRNCFAGGTGALLESLTQVHELAYIELGAFAFSLWT